MFIASSSVISYAIIVIRLVSHGRTKWNWCTYKYKLWGQQFTGATTTTASHESECRSKRGKERERKRDPRHIMTVKGSWLCHWLRGKPALLCVIRARSPRSAIGCSPMTVAKWTTWIESETPEFPEINCHSYESKKFCENCRCRPNDYFYNSTLYNNLSVDIEILCEIKGHFFYSLQFLQKQMTLELSKFLHANDSQRILFHNNEQGQPLSSISLRPSIWNYSIISVIWWTFLLRGQCQIYFMLISADKYRDRFHL